MVAEEPAAVNLLGQFWHSTGKPAAGNRAGMRKTPGPSNRARAFLHCCKGKSGKVPHHKKQRHTGAQHPSRPGRHPEPRWRIRTAEGPGNQPNRPRNGQRRAERHQRIKVERHIQPPGKQSGNRARSPAAGAQQACRPAEQAARQEKAHRFPQQPATCGGGQQQQGQRTVAPRVAKQPCSNLLI